MINLKLCRRKLFKILIRVRNNPGRKIQKIDFLANNSNYSLFLTKKASSLLMIIIKLIAITLDKQSKLHKILVTLSLDIWLRSY